MFLRILIKSDGAFRLIFQPSALLRLAPNEVTDESEKIHRCICSQPSLPDGRCPPDEHPNRMALYPHAQPSRSRDGRHAPRSLHERGLLILCRLLLLYKFELCAVLVPYVAFVERFALFVTMNSSIDEILLAREMPGAMMRLEDTNNPNDVIPDSIIRPILSSGHRPSL